MLDIILTVLFVGGIVVFVGWAFVTYSLPALSAL
jgi:hypothetical protein